VLFFTAGLVVFEVPTGVIVKLDSVRAPVDVLVIDSVEAPTPD
jgi:hypothetical protein